MIEKFHDMIWKYAHDPFHHLRGVCEVYDLRLTADEKEELFYSLQVECLELINEYKPSDEMSLEKYLGIKLGWRAVNMAKRMANEKKLTSPVDIETIESGRKISTNSDLSPQMIEALDELSPRQREVIELQYIHNYKTSQIAHQLGISKQAVVSNRKHGLENLRKILTGGKG